VFDDTKSVAVLRRSFNPVFFPKPEGQEEIDALEKTRSTARRLEGLLQRVEGLDEKLVDALQSKLATLREDVDALLLEARKAQETQQAS
jgi:ABC-type phosphate transport system auxiliary subunit